jgi:hypothetical protein
VSSLVLGGASTHSAIKTSPTGMTTLTTLTWIGYVYPTTLTSGRVMWSRRDDGPDGPFFSLSGTGGDVRFVRDHATTDTDYITNNTPLSALNAWRCLAVTFDTGAGAGEFVNIYHGSFAALLAECTYGTATDGTGALTADGGTGTAYRLGNNNGDTTSFQGRIGPAALFNRVLSLGELQSWQYRPRVMAGCVAFHVCGINGTTNVPDWSGNGNLLATTSLTLGNLIPLRRMGR